ncbi:MAG: hypothetical protein UT02_C0007G0023, partial [Parcubacteria group bacterium GW2011_GWC2_38_7]
YGAERAHLSVERAFERLVDVELGEGAVAEDQEDLAVRLPLGLRGRGDEHRTQQQDCEQVALHRSLQMV